MEVGRILYETMEFFSIPNADMKNYNNISVLLITVIQLILYVYNRNTIELQPVDRYSSFGRIDPQLVIPLMINQEKISSIAYITPNRIKALGLPLYSDQCSICMNDFPEDVQVAYTKCYHMFCSTCISEWMKQQMNCPCCRTKLNN
jgi:hypothetical protein